VAILNPDGTKNVSSEEMNVIAQLIQAEAILALVVALAADKEQEGTREMLDKLGAACYQNRQFVQKQIESIVAPAPHNDILEKIKNKVSGQGGTH
jgi:hypothetical protein